MERYSQELHAEITAYFRKKCGVELSPEEAEQYLDSLADLYPMLQRSIREGFPPSESGGKRAAR